MSIVPAASDQMGPGGYGLGNPIIPMAQTGLVVGTQVGLTVISLAGVGKLLKGARVISAADAALLRLYQSGRIPFIGGSTYYPPGWIGPALTMAAGTVSNWFTPPSGGGGPGEIPNLHRPPPSIEEAGKLISNPPMVVDVSSSPRPSTSKKGRKGHSCPPGKVPVWSHRKKRYVCMKVPRKG